MKTATTYAIMLTHDPETLGSFEQECIEDAQEQGFTVIKCVARYATPEVIPLLPSEVLLAAIEAGAGIAVAFIDYEPAGVEENEDSQ